MENTGLYTFPSSPSFFHLMESEEDFPFGAKTTSFLPPATVTNPVTSTTATYDLPEWMEGREILGLPHLPEWREGQEILGLPHMTEDLSLSLPLHASTDQEDTLPNLKEDYCSIKPEDMLVPLSELQPPHTPASPPFASIPPASPPLASTPPASPVSPRCVPISPVSSASASVNPPLPKIIICRKVTTSSPKSKPTQVQFQIMPVKQVPQVTPRTPLQLDTAPQKSHVGQAAVMPLEGSHGQPRVHDMALEVPQNAPGPQTPQACDAEDLINELVQMISSSSSSTGGFQDLENVSFDASEMEATVEDLLFRLEASESVTNTLDTKPLPSTAPASLSTLVPSESLSPVSPASLSASFSSESSFSPTCPSPGPSEFPSPASPACLPSPVPSLGSLSPANSASESLFSGEEKIDMECLEETWSPLEETHSYSRSQRKARSSHRTSGARKTPYPEDRRERKKEQNKQAALRYRQKKKQEEDELMEKIQAEEERQEKLKSKYSGLKQELSYLKKIMREVFMARGLLSEEALKKAALEKKQLSGK